jgi:hypothetical protein
MAVLCAMRWLLPLLLLLLLLVALGVDFATA